VILVAGGACRLVSAPSQIGFEAFCGLISETERDRQRHTKDSREKKEARQFWVNVRRGKGYCSRHVYRFPVMISHSVTEMTTHLSLLLLLLFHTACFPIHSTRQRKGLGDGDVNKLTSRAWPDDRHARSIGNPCASRSGQKEKRSDVSARCGRGRRICTSPLDRRIINRRWGRAAYTSCSPGISSTDCDN
jgi:hypothetical protein